MREDDEENDSGVELLVQYQTPCPEPSCARSRDLPDNNIRELLVEVELLV